MDIFVKHLGLTDSEKTWKDMKDFVSANPENDEIWVTEHQPIFTTGLNKKNSYVPETNIPHLFVDRGGKITYHGPGQLIIYLLINLRKNNLKIRQLVDIIEKSIIKLLSIYNIKNSYSKKNAPGVYVSDKKIASIGMRVKNHYTYHGLSLNIDMDLSPFKLISPCGFDGLEMTQVSALNNDYNDDIGSTLVKLLQHNIK